MNLPIEVSVSSFTWETVEALCNQSEGQYLEFKRSLHAQNEGESDAWQRDLEREINAFANGNGGIILFGVDDDGTVHPFEPPEHELAQSVTRLVQNSKPVPDLEISESLSPPDSDTERIVLAVEISEAVRKPVLTSDSAVYRRINDRKEPMSRDQMESLFVDHDRRQQALRQLEMEINRFGDALDEMSVHSAAPPDFHLLNTEELKEVLRENTHLYSDEEIRKTLNRVFKWIREIEDREAYVGRVLSGYTDATPNNREQFYREQRRDLEEDCKRLQRRLADLADQANLEVNIQ